MKKSSCLLALTLALFAAASIAPAAGSAAFGPPQSKCGKLKGAAKAACKKRNADSRRVFAAIADSRFTGRTFGGADIDALFCANGKWQVKVYVTEELTYSGKSWKLTEANTSRNYLGGLATGPSNNIYTRVGLQRRSGKWVLSQGNPMTSAPPLTKTDASAECATLQV